MRERRSWARSLGLAKTPLIKEHFNVMLKSDLNVHDEETVDSAVFSLAVQNSLLKNSCVDYKLS